jgi:hypothetical protein
MLAQGRGGSSNRLMRISAFIQRPIARSRYYADRACAHAAVRCHRDRMSLIRLPAGGCNSDATKDYATFILSGKL